VHLTGAAPSLLDAPHVPTTSSQNVSPNFQLFSNVHKTHHQTQPPLFHLLDRLLNLQIPFASLQQSQGKQPCQSQPHIPPHPNPHTGIVMTRQLVMLIRPNPRRDVMKQRRSHHSLCVRDRASLRSRRKWHSVCKGDEDEGEGNETPAVVANVVGLKVVGGEVQLRRGAEP